MGFDGTNVSFSPDVFEECSRVSTVCPEERREEKRWQPVGSSREASGSRAGEARRLRPRHVTLAAAMTASEAEVRVSEREVKHTQPAGPRSLDPPLPGLASLNSSPVCRSERRSLLLEMARRLV